MIDDLYWRSHFAADPAIAGSPIEIDRIPFTVIGVAPRGFSGVSVGGGPDLWVPLHALDRLQPDGRRWTEPFASWLTIGGRLRPGVSRAQAQAEVDVLSHRFLAERMASSPLGGMPNVRHFVRDSHLVLRPAATGMESRLRSQYAFPLELLMAVAGMVLLIACANIANLLLARASQRRREMAVRLALGAGRARLVRQLLTDSLVLALAGGALALPLAWWGGSALVRAISTGDTPVPLDVAPDLPVFVFTAAISLLTAILFGLAPALRATRADPASEMKGGARVGGRRSHPLERGLVVAQVALSLVLIAGAGLFAQTLQKLWSVDIGYDRDNVLLFSVDARLAGGSNGHAGAVYREILDRVRALPGVLSASASIVRPVDDEFNLEDRVGEIDGQSLPEAGAIQVSWNAIGPGYFPTVSTPILAGRDFDLRDGEGAPRVAVVNQSFAKRAFPGRNPLGHRLGDSTIVGVVKDARYNGAREQPGPVVYYPLFQHGPNQEFQWGFVSFELRYAAGASLMSEVRREVVEVDPNLPVFRVRTLVEQAGQNLLRERLLAELSGIFAALALLLACVGLYGLMACAVARRTGEIGIRMALGARRGHVLWLVLREALWLTLGGVGIGVFLTLGAARYAKSVLFGVGPSDPLTMAAAGGALIFVAALAGFLSARRALRIDAALAVRCE